jgi:hypothetical protein
MHTPSHKPTNTAPKPKPKPKRDFPDQNFAPSPDEGYRGTKKSDTKPDFPDQNLAPSPDEGYRGEKKMAKGGFARAGSKTKEEPIMNKKVKSKDPLSKVKSVAHKLADKMLEAKAAGVPPAITPPVAPATPMMKKGGAAQRDKTKEYPIMNKKVKKMAVGGMPDQANQGGAMRGLDQAAAMSGRNFSDIGRPAGAGMGRPDGMPDQSNSGGAMRGLDRAAAMSGRDFSGMGRPLGAGAPAGVVPGRPLGVGAPVGVNAPITPAIPAGMKKGGAVKMARGGGAEIKGKTKGRVVKMARGGSVKSSASRGDGAAQRGRTKGRTL